MPSLTKKSLSLAVAVVVFEGCQVDPTPPPDPNFVSVELDGVPVPFRQPSSAAYIDTTKQLLGPNTHLLFMIATIADGGQALGGVLEINIPIGVGPGAHPVRFKGLPGRDDVWVRYEDALAGNKWTAYDGILNVRAVGNEGERFQADFDQLKLTNSCGQEHTLTKGTINVNVGSEASWAQSEVWTPTDTTVSDVDLIENGVVLDIDDTVYGCPYSDLSPVADAADGGATIPMVRIIAPCQCYADAKATTPISSFAISADLPVKSSDVGAGLDTFALYVDVSGTPDNTDDDELWFGLETPMLTIRAAGTALHMPVDIDADGPDPLAFVVRGDNPMIDVSRVKMLKHASFYGMINSQ